MSITKKEQIEIRPYTEWHLLDGDFNADRVLQSWVKKEKAASLLNSNSKYVTCYSSPSTRASVILPTLKPLQYTSSPIDS
jgi:hypothetical protein